MNSFNRIKGRNILIDTNVIINYSKEGFAKRSGEFLEELIKNDNILYVSHFTGFELLRDQDEGEIKDKYIKFLNEVNNIEVSFNVIKNSVLLSTDYRKILNGKKVDLGDLLVGATAILKFRKKEKRGVSKKTLLLTENRQHFPELLWKSIACHPVFSDNNEKVINIFYLLEFNTSYIQRLKKEYPELR